MEAKLEKYRNQKKRREIFERIKTRFISMITPSRDETKKNEDEKIPIPETDDEENDEESADEIYSSDEIESLAEEEKPKEPMSKLTMFTYFVYVCFWLTCWAIAIEMKFGIVFLLLSALFGIYFNTRTGPKKRNEISAYSVFNKNCESIDGTLKAEQFEREIRYGPGSVR